MRDFRYAKDMARALRNALKSKAIEITHAEALDLIAKAFGVADWNTLARCDPPGSVHPSRGRLFPPLPTANVEALFPRT